MSVYSSLFCNFLQNTATMFYWKIEFKWTLIFSLVSIMWMVMERILGLHNGFLEYHFYFSLLSIIPLYVVFTLAIKDKGVNRYEGENQLMNSIYTLLKLILLVTISSPFVQYLALSYVSPNYFKNLAQLAIEQSKLTDLEEAKSVMGFEAYAFMISLKYFSLSVAASIIVLLVNLKKVGSLRSS